MEARAGLDNDLERAFRLGPGPEKEREINRLVMALISGLVKDASPEACGVWFDWGQEGLCITSIRDGQGEPCIAPDDVDGFLSTYASNVQDSRYAPQLTAIRGVHGPFVLQV